jgi:3-deoxy-manno-octulosonate cytidylyltransferase (CMP-KDO synthetase)
VSTPSRHPEVLTVVPARLDSTRLPGKLLKTIYGKPIIYWVAHRIRSFNLTAFVVATDSTEISEVCEQFDLPYVMTSAGCANGTERVQEVASLYAQFSHFMNVQGDEPLISFDVLDQMVKTIGVNDHAFKAAVSTIAREENDPSEVKVAMQLDNRIRYASRSFIPFDRDGESSSFKIHGVFLYTREVLAKFTQAPVGVLEATEKLEQLRCIENEIELYGVICQESLRSIDTMKDLELYRRIPQEFFDDPTREPALNGYLS